MQQWEYKTVGVVVAKSIDGKLNELGRQGWELVCWRHMSEGLLGQFQLVMKRPIEQARTVSSPPPVLAA